METNNNQLNFTNLYSDNIIPANNQANSFDIFFWIFKILRYWYLFLIGLVLALGIAYMKNLKWTPTYKTTSTMLIEETKKQGVGDLSANYYGSQNPRAINNQMIMYASYDLISKAVDKLNVNCDVYKKQYFSSIHIKDINQYKTSPVKVKGTYVANEAYGLEFGIKAKNESTYELTCGGNDQIPAFQITGEYGKSLQHNLFFIEVDKTDYFQNITPYELYFRFLSKDQQIGDYSSRLTCKFLMEGATVMEISLVGKAADRDVDFMDILNKEFFIDNLRRKNASAERAIEFINEQLSILKDSITSSESKLNMYQMQSGIYSQDQSARTGSELDALDKQRSEIRLKKEYVNFLNDYLKRDNELLIPPSSAGIQDPGLAALVENYNNFSMNMKTLGPESPIYKRYKLQQEEIRKGLTEAINTMNSSTQIEESSLSRRYNKIMAEVASLPEKERKLLTHERDFKINDSYNTYLLQRRIENQIIKASNAPDNVILDQPRTVYIVNGQDKSNTYLLFGSIGLLLPLIFVTCKEILFKFSVQSRDEVERISGLPVLGTIERSNKKELVVIKNYPRSSFTEGFRSLRSRMEYIVKKESPIVMLVTSTEPKDGKTFIACNVASVYQITGKRTLIVDLDLRRPALSKLLDAEHKRGVSNYLIGQVKLSDVIFTHPDHDFDVLPAGTIPPNPSELLRMSKTREMLDDLKKDYDYIILDCSPIGLVSDAHFLSKMVDVTLYVVRNEKTNRNFFRYTISEMKEDMGDGNVAIIYNDVNLRGSGYYGSRKYYGRSSYYLKHDSYYRNDEREQDTPPVS